MGSAQICAISCITRATISTDVNSYRSNVIETQHCFDAAGS
jgi:hypothetical protein